MILSWSLDGNVCLLLLTWNPQVRELRFDSSRSFDLDDVLLIFGQLGLLAYNIFTLIAGYYTINEDEDSPLVLLSALAALFQVSKPAYLLHI